MYDNKNFFHLDTFRSTVRPQQNVDEIPLIGAHKTLTCFPEELGYPIRALSANWYLDGEMISESDKYQMIDTYT